MLQHRVELVAVPASCNVTAMQIDLYPIPDWIPPYDDVDLGTQLK